MAIYMSTRGIPGIGKFHGIRQNTHIYIYIYTHTHTHTNKRGKDFNMFHKIRVIKWHFKKDEKIQCREYGWRCCLRNGEVGDEGGDEA